MRAPTSLYSRWADMRRNGGTTADWDDYRTFERWCLERHVAPGDRLRRIDTSRPWGPDNISDSQLKDSPYYARWRSMRYNGGVRPRWEDFRAFERWCREHHVKPGDRLQRIDASCPWGPDNIEDEASGRSMVTDSPYYRRWVDMRRHGGIQSEWEDFRAFEQWCLDHHVEPGDRLYRVDVSRPWGPGNVEVGRYNDPGAANPPHYARWRGMRRHGGLQSEWADFRAFEQWCRGHHVGPGDRLQRVEASLPWGPGNVEVRRHDDPGATDSPYYRRWINMRRNGGVQHEWDDFPMFERWCVEHHVKPGDQLRRTDTKRLWGPDNTQDRHVESAGLLQNRGAVRPE